MTYVVTVRGNVTEIEAKMKHILIYSFLSGSDVEEGGEAEADLTVRSNSIQLKLTLVWFLKRNNESKHWFL